MTILFYLVHIGGTFMFKLFKTNNIEVLYNSKIDDDELKNKIVEQIINLQILTRGSYSSEEFDSKKEWFFIRKNDEVTTAVGLKEIKVDKKSTNVYALSDFVNAATTASKANSNELTELFSEVVRYAKNDSQIDYLVCAIPQKINARPLARAGFNAKLFKNSYFHSGILNELSNYIILNSDEKLPKSEILAKIRSEEQSRRTLFKKMPKSLVRELRIISENRKFIEKSKEPYAYYYGLIAGINVKK